MSTNRDEDMLHLLHRLKEDLLLARQYRLEHTIHLLEIAILDVNTVVHAISDDELRCLTDRIGGHDSSEEVLAPRDKRPKPAKSMLSLVRRN